MICVLLHTYIDNSKNSERCKYKMEKQQLKYFLWWFICIGCIHVYQLCQWVTCTCTMYINLPAMNANFIACYALWQRKHVFISLIEKYPITKESKRHKKSFKLLTYKIVVYTCLSVCLLHNGNLKIIYSINYSCYHKYS